MPVRLRSLQFLLLAVLAAVALAACGGDGDEATASTDVNQLLKETFTGDKKVDSGRLNVVLGVNATGGQASGPINVKLAGPFQTQGDNRLPKLKMDLDFSGSGQNVKAGVTSTGDKGFVNFNNQDYAVSDQIFKQFQAGYEQAQKQAAQENKDQQSLSTLGIDPRKWLTNARNEGESKVGDADTIRITGGVDVPKLLEDINRALEKAATLGLQDQGRLPEKLTDEQRRQAAEAVKGLRVEIHTGREDKILRRMLVDMDVQPPAGTSGQGPQAAAIKLDFSLTELNQDQEIAAPANTKPLDELLGQFGGLGGLGGLGGSGSDGSGGAGGSGGSSADQEQLQKYTDCITEAGSDTKKAQECAKLLTP
ncbi:MAG: hypothetical protein M3P50_11300 [Actinomycetota bacterium]|nr:hypothetical protein [Actinomycetota bacterium]